MYKCELGIYSTSTNKRTPTTGIITFVEKVESEFSIAQIELKLYSLPLFKVRPSPQEHPNLLVLYHVIEVLFTPPSTHAILSKVDTERV